MSQNHFENPKKNIFVRVGLKELSSKGFICTKMGLKLQANLSFFKFFISTGAASADHSEQLPVPGETHLSELGGSLWKARLHGNREDHAGQYLQLWAADSEQRIWPEIVSGAILHQRSLDEGEVWRCHEKKKQQLNWSIFFSFFSAKRWLTKKEKVTLFTSVLNTVTLLHTMTNGWITKLRRGWSVDFPVKTVTFFKRLS